MAKWIDRRSATTVRKELRVIHKEGQWFEGTAMERLVAQEMRTQGTERWPTSEMKKQEERTPLTDAEPAELSLPMTLEEMETCLKRAKRKTTPGYDQTPTFLITHSTTFVKESFAAALNAQRGRPDQHKWALGKAVMTAKEGKDSTQLKGWRMLTMCGNIYKVAMGILKARIQTVAEAKGWFSDKQFGFRTKKDLY